MYAKPIEQLIRAFSKLPTVGPRTAERFVFHLLRSGKKDVGEITLALKGLMEEVRSCEVCWDFSDKSPCAVCADEKRDRSMICVVAQPQDVQALEKTGGYAGLYHILRGTIKADDEDKLKFLKLRELFVRLKEGEVEEVILALNPNLDGETTMMILEQKLKQHSPDVKVSRLARGLPMGSDLQYADEITLGSALKYRQ